MSNMLGPEERENVQKLSSLIRYNNAIHIHKENVAEHSFYVSYYTMLLCRILKLPDNISKLTIERAIIHDVHECELSDIPHDVKVRNKELNELCIKFEEEYNKEKFYGLMHDISELKEEDKELVEEIVRLADVISVWQYAIQELSFGNTERFSEVKRSAIARIGKSINIIAANFAARPRSKIIYADYRAWIYKEIFGNAMIK